MERKRLGRGLEDIADIFLSQQKGNIHHDDSAEGHMRERFGESHQGNFTEDTKGSIPFSEDDIITVLDGRLNVNRNRLKALKPAEHESSRRDGGDRPREKKETSEDCTAICDITEHVIAKKKLEYKKTPDVQHNIVRSLFEHLRQNYNIRKIELVKLNEVSRPGINNRIEENILICVKEEGNY